MLPEYIDAGTTMSHRDSRLHGVHAVDASRVGLKLVGVNGDFRPHGRGRGREQPFRDECRRVCILL
jgi:hypothetical protein